MSRLKILISCLLLIFLISTTYSQKLNHRQGEIILQLSNKSDLRQLLSDYSQFNRKSTGIQASSVCTQPLELTLVSFDWTEINENKLLQSLLQEPYIRLAQKNRIIKSREEPNDPRFSEQWQYLNADNRDLDMDLAWDIATGGTTTRGDEIVVAVIDEEFDLTHEDLVENLWKNTAEVPNNGIDDDNNGYIDDYDGWNVGDNSDNLKVGPHGLSVSGIIGAKGNNNLGVAGMNWDVKVMSIDYGSVTEASALASYAYAYEMRKEYNETNGAKGAFIVATNASWGIDEGKAEDAPIWCEFYNELGQIGIINCAATANNNVDVDVVGDLPTACTSEYLIAVTNMNSSDRKVNSAGYGRKSIDIGAYGSGAFTIRLNNGYGSFGGTSGATPHVTGLAALIYSVACDEFMDLVKTEPALAALAVKDFILNGTKPIDDLLEITTTRGKLNGKNTLDQVRSLCQSAKAPHAFRIETFALGQMKLDWLGGTNTTTDIRYRQVDQTGWTTVTNINKGHILQNLPVCSEYEFQFRSSFDNDWGYSRFLYTSGCCVLPSSIDVSLVDNKLSVEFDSDFNSSFTIIEYKEASQANWTEAQIDDGEFLSDYLDYCNSYLVRLKSICSNTSNESSYSTVYQINTPCNECDEVEYCRLSPKVNTFEWIESVSIGGTTNISGKNLGAYAFFGNIFSFDFKANQSYPVELVPGYLNDAFNEYFKIYIDKNRNGMFEEDELVFDAGSLTNTPISGTLSVPNDIDEGYARLRVLMSYNAPAEACEDGISGFSDGEYEDYCIYISNSSCERVNQVHFDEISTTEVSISWTDTGANSYEISVTNIQSGNTFQTTSNENNVLINNLEKCESYVFEITSNCSNVQSNISDPYIRSTRCSSSTTEDPYEILSINQAYMFYNDLKVNYTSDRNVEMQLSIFDLQGRVIQSSSELWLAGNTTKIVEAPQLRTGIYVLVFSTDNFIQTKKLMYHERH